MSTLKIYQCEITPERNALVDHIDRYLNNFATLTYARDNFQEIQLGLDINIKIDLGQYYVGHSIGNYASIDQDGKIWYYFIMSAQWKAKNTVELSLSIDSVNTFNGDFTFTKKTHIIRQHKNRFSNLSTLEPGTNVLYNVIDDVDEGVNGAVQYKVSDTVVRTGNVYLDQRWYLVYESLNTDDNSGVKCTLYPETKIPFSATVTNKIIPTGLTRNYDYYISGRRDPNSGIFFVNSSGIATGVQNGDYYEGRKILCILYRQAVNTHVAVVEILVEDGNREPEWIEFARTGTDKPITPRGADGYFYGLSSNRSSSLNVIESNTYYTYTTTITTKYIEGINFVDRKSPTLLKIIELPYRPADFTWDDDLRIQLPEGWNYGYSQDAQGEHYFLLPNIDTEFGSTIVEDQNLGLTQTIELTEEQILSMSELAYKRDILLKDPKLLHSSLYTYKLVYDSYSLPIVYEKITQTDTIFDKEGKYDIYFKPSNTINSNLGFKINFKDASYTTAEDYGEYLIATRNNESPIYNNSYLNYLRTGYNYDRKAQTTQNTQTWISAGVQLVGGIAAAVSGVSTGGLGTVAGISLITSGIATLSGAITSSVNSERAIQSKLADLKAQAASISTSDDLNLLNWYNGNKLHIMRYQVSPKVLNLMNDAFYYFGYADDKYDIPKLKTRFWFNYIQCEPKFEEENTSVYQNYLADIKARYSAGVTVYHMFNDSWDWKQNRENWESNLIPIY